MNYEAAPIEAAPIEAAPIEAAPMSYEAAPMNYESGIVTEGAVVTEGGQAGQTFEGSFDLQPGESIVPGSVQTIGTSEGTPMEAKDEAVESASDTIPAPVADAAADAPAAEATDAPPAPTPEASDE